MSGDVAPRCAICRAPASFDSPTGKVPGWLVLCCGANACRAMLEDDEASVAAEYARRERCHGNDVACEHAHGE